ncbi:MAG: GTPase ObgE [Chloroflexi bacterium]|nr:MAG: GTPase ObgE [Chloroflexota bacterium]TMC34648.1 MAG: GTPase ObgE [Chloroflexota bacterium]TMC57092.1 MAG: GTPase ObgE [Chloroflexota bacterium]
MFLDRARIKVRGGDGGRGVISFRREAHVPRGGPDGGDGGNGGDLVLRADAQLASLGDFQFKKEYRATDGAAGEGGNRSGKAGRDLVVGVPAGTTIRDVATNEEIADLVADGAEIVVARGGRGGRGNARFVTSTRRAPRIAMDGETGEQRALDLELRLIADVGLAGLPNAGKSSLLAALTRARPKIADYPFTTLTPNLGVARLDDRELVIADIPGLIEGASQGAGLGEEFLRHIERTRVVVHVVDASKDDPLADIATIDAELEAYGHGLRDRPEIIALNKIDLAEARDQVPELVSALEARGREALALSAATGEGVDRLSKRLFVLTPPRVAPQAAPDERRIVFKGSARDVRVLREGEAFRVRGDRIERLASGIDWDSGEASAYFHRMLQRNGVEKRLRELGVKEGDTVKIGRLELEWKDRE